MRRCFLFLALFTLIAGIAPAWAAAQTATEIRGVVTDQVARPMAGVTVAVHNDATGADLDPVKTDDRGMYIISPIEPGTYDVTAKKVPPELPSAPGTISWWADATHRNAVVRIGEITRIGFQMTIESEGLATPAEAVVSHEETDCNVPPTQAISYVGLPLHPFGAVASTDGCWLFVTVDGANPPFPSALAVLRRSGGMIKVQRLVALKGEHIGGAVLTHDRKLLIVADDRFVAFLDVHRLLTGERDPIVGYMRDRRAYGIIYVNVTADDKYLFVSDESSATITVTNLEKARRNGYKPDAIVGQIPTGFAPIALTFSTDGRLLYTTSEVASLDWQWPIACKDEGPLTASAPPKRPEGAILVVDVKRAETDSAHAVVSRIAAGCNPVRLALSPDGLTAWVTERGNNAAAAFDAAKLVSDPSGARIGTIPVGASPVGVVMADHGKRVIVTNSDRFAAGQTVNQTLTIIDPAKMAQGVGAVVGSVPAGAFPREFAETADGKTLFVTNYNSNNVEVVDLARLHF
jgi:DNA-binding beta-propeller fold protein YncE